MKHKNLLIIPLVFGLTACTWSYIVDGDTKATLLKKVNVYSSIETLDATSVGTIKKLSELKIGEVQYRILKDEPLIPYLSVKEYESLYSSYFSDKATSVVKDYGSSVEWTVSLAQTVTNPDTGAATTKNATIFVSLLDFVKQTFTYSGSFSNAYKPSSSDINSDDYLAGTKFTGEILNKDKVTATTMSFKGFELDPIRVGRTYFLPLGLMDHLFSKASGKSVYNTFNGFFMVSSATSLPLTRFYEKEGDTEESNILFYTRNNAVQAIGRSFQVEEKKPGTDQMVTNTYAVMPMYLRKYYRKSLLFVFENFYGLKYSRGIKSMAEYIKNQPYYDDFLSEDPLVRGEALNSFVAELQDGHTSLAMTNAAVWYEAIADKKDGPMWDERIKLRNDLIDARNNAYLKYEYDHATSDEEREAISAPGYTPDQYSVKYSDDGNMAFFHFNSFLFAKNDPTNPDLYQKDTFTYFVRQFKDIANHADVKDVVIDLSTNGGGILIALLKILALISDTNSADVDQYTQNTNAQLRMTMSVDTDGNGEYNADDVYGDDYSIYLLCSPFSFSCGNAYPFMAKKEGFATIMGARSGGGECTVGNTMLSSGLFINHSSLSRLGVFNPIKDDGGEVTGYQFEGDEKGIPADDNYEISYFNYYNFEYLNQLIKTNKSA